VPKKIVETVFKVTVDQMVDFQTMASASSAQPGIIGTSLHYSNAITAMSIALGQDPACAAESHIGITSGYRTENGDMYCSVMMPNLLVATMGGGTKLPTQRACLDMMGVYGANKANELAEIMAAVCLAGELSLTAAIVSDDFARAHQILARGDIQINSNSSVQDRFEKAAVEIMRLPSLPNRDTMIKIYGLYKQATVGDVNIPKPKLTSDLKTKAKYKAWKKKKGVPKEEAMKEYIAIIEGLLGHPIGGVAAPSSSSSSSSGKSSTMSSNQVNSSSSANNHGVAAASPLSSASPSSSQEPSSPSSAALASSPSFEITQDDVNEVAAVEVNLVGHVDPEERLASISPAQSIDNIAANTDGNSSSAVASASPSSGLAISTPNSHASVTPLSPIQEQQQNQQARRGSSTISGDESIEALKRQIEALKAENGELKKTITELREPLETMRRLLD
jgi:acyl-CoA-binding protein